MKSSNIFLGLLIFLFSSIYVYGSEYTYDLAYIDRIGVNFSGIYKLGKEGSCQMFQIHKDYQNLNVYKFDNMTLEYQLFNYTNIEDYRNKISECRNKTIINIIKDGKIVYNETNYLDKVVEPSPKFDVIVFFFDSKWFSSNSEVKIAYSYFVPLCEKCFFLLGRNSFNLKNQKGIETGGTIKVIFPQNTKKVWSIPKQNTLSVENDRIVGIWKHKDFLFGRFTANFFTKEDFSYFTSQKDNILNVFFVVFGFILASLLGIIFIFFRKNEKVIVFITKKSAYIFYFGLFSHFRTTSAWNFDKFSA